MLIELRGIKELGNLCSGFRKQLPFATANALNEVGFGVMRGLKSSLSGDLDVLRNSFTARSIQVDKANKGNLKAEVGFESKAYYMSKLNDKETRHPTKSKYLAIPTTYARRGNTIKGLLKSPMRLGVIKFHIKSSKYFILPMKNGHKGIFVRVSKGGLRRKRERTTSKSQLVLVYTLVKQASYNKRDYYNFELKVMREAKAINFQQLMMKHLLKAVR